MTAEMREAFEEWAGAPAGECGTSSVYAFQNGWIKRTESCVRILERAADDLDDGIGEEPEAIRRTKATWLREAAILIMEKTDA